MLPDDQPMPQLTSPQPRIWTGVGILMGMMLGIVLTESFAVLRRWPSMPIALLIMMGLFVAPIVLGGVVGAFFEALARRGDAARERVRLGFGSRDQTVRIADAVDGPVEIRGVVRVIKPVISQVHQKPCAAYSLRRPITYRTRFGRRVESKTEFEADSAIGELEIVDDSGAVAHLRAGACEVYAGLSGMNSSAMVLEGARVVVRGMAHWETESNSEVSYRSVQRRLEITGSEQGPMMLRPDDDAIETAAPVRVELQSTAGASDPAEQVEEERAVDTARSIDSGSADH